jgi:hypothetical protein
MTDEPQVRALLTAAAELPDSVEPPVDRLLERGRRRRRIRRILAPSASAAVLALVIASLVPLLSASGPKPERKVGTVSPGTAGPSAAQIARFRWSALPPSPLGPRTVPIVAWTGKYLIELGGFKKYSSQYDGAAYDPATGRWHDIAPPVNMNIGFWNAVTAWTGRQLFVTNGQFESCLSIPGHPGTPANCWPHAGLYDPATNRWTQIKLPVPMYGLYLMAAVWTGRDVILAGVNHVHHPTMSVAAYDPATNHWQMITPRLPAGHPASLVAMAATGDRVILWSLWAREHRIGNGYSIRSGVDVLALARNLTWSNVTGRWPQGRIVQNPVYGTGQVLIPPGQMWCGLSCRHPPGTSPPYLANSTTLAQRTLPRGPLGSFLSPAPIWLWNGRAVLAINAATSVAGTPPTPPARMVLAALDPATGHWLDVPRPPGGLVLAANPVWAGRELFALTTAGQLLVLHGH